MIKIINLENLNKIIKTYFDRIVEDRNEADKIWLHLNHLKNEMEQIYTSYSNIADKAIITGEIVDRLAEYEDTGLYSRGDVSMVFAEIERLQAENRRLKKSVDNQCDDCACEIANERDKAIKDLVEEDWRNRNE